MSLTEAEVALCNQALDRIASANITYASQTTNEALKCITIYEQTRNSLLRSFDWPFASARAELAAIYTITLDSAPVPSAWAVDDVIYGTKNGYSATVITVTSDSVYEIAYLSGDFEDSEKLTNADVEKVYYNGVEVEWEDEIVLYWDSSDADEVQCGVDYPVFETTTPVFGWDYQYLLPEDFLRLRLLDEADYTTAVNDRCTIEGNRLLTNFDTANIEYIKKETDPSKFDPLFTEVLVLNKAIKLCTSLPGAGPAALNLKNELKEELRQIMFRVRAVCKSETNVTGRSDWNLARYGSGIV